MKIYIGTGTGFVEDNFSTDGVQGRAAMVQEVM